MRALLITVIFDLIFFAPVLIEKKWCGNTEEDIEDFKAFKGIIWTVIFLATIVGFIAALCSF